MVSSSSNHQHCHGQCSTGRKVLLTALTIATATSLMAAEAFSSPTMVASFGNSRATTTSNTKLNYVVYGGDQSTTAANNIEIEKPKTKKAQRKSTNVHHGYIVSNHDNERSFWLHALQNLEPTSKESDQSLWTRIACAYGPKEFRETKRIEPTADLVRVGDGDLDICLAVPLDSWDASRKHKNVVSVASKQQTRGNRQLVTIRVDFPEGSSFDKDAYSFEDELTAVIGQVRLLEQTANDKLSKLEA